MISKLTLVLVFCVSLLLVGCGKSNPMIGTWKLDIPAEQLKKLPAGMTAPTVTVEFKADNTYLVNADFFGQKHTAEGTYKVEEKTLTMTGTKDDGKPAKDTKPQTVTLAEDGKSFELPGSNGQGKMVKQ